MPTGIEWTDETWNPVVGCTKVSPGCKYCYAKTLHDKRHKASLAGKRVHPQYAREFEQIQLMPDRLDAPLHWRKPRRVFVNSVSDLFHESVPDGFLAQVWTKMYAARMHTFQILTKRPERMRDFVNRCGAWEGWITHDGTPPTSYGGTGIVVGDEEHWPLPNVWLGTSVENQKYADERIPLLLETPAAVRFLSCEPLLGPVDLRYLPIRDGLTQQGLHGIDWVIVGGESGKGARPMHPDWPRKIRDHCVAAGVPFFFKQWGEYRPEDRRTTYNGERYAPRVVFVHVGGNVHDPQGALRRPSNGARPFDPFDAGHPGWEIMKRVGKKWAGRELDGRTWDDFPSEAVTV